jgi:hypothetical protein
MGSFFSNPLQDSFEGEDGKMWANAWPHEDLPTLKPAVQELSLTMKGTAELLSCYLDIYIKDRLSSFAERIEEKRYQESKRVAAETPMTLRHEKKCGYFERTVTDTTKVNCRLIHYYPCKEGFKGQWTGWHKDIGMLTCLTPALYTDHNGNEISWSDPAVGLHGQTKSGEVVKVNVPKDCMII